MHKTTLYLLVGLVIAVFAGGYVVFGASLAPEGQVDGSTTGQTSSNGEIQEVYIKALPDGSYDTDEVKVKVGIPVRIHFTAQGNIGCGSGFVLYGLNQQTSSKNGQEGIIEFTPTTPGTYTYSCGMNMWGPGKFLVEDTSGNIPAATAQNAPVGNTCGMGAGCGCGAKLR